MLLRSLVLAAALTATTHAGDQQITFLRTGICTATLDGKNQKKLGPGAWPNMSPDGTRVAFNTEDEKSSARRIAIADLATGKTAVVKGIPGDNCFGPVWSPQGGQLAFSIFVGSDWKIGIVGADGSGFRYLEPDVPTSGGLFAPAWAADGRSIFCQDMDTIFRVGLDGRVLRQWKVTALFGEKGSLNSGSLLAPSPDGKTLLVDVDMAEDIERPEWDGPPPAIWQIDLATGKATQVTKTELFAWHPAWINDHEILCNHTPNGAKQIAVYRLDLKTQQPRLVVKNAQDATVSKSR